MAQGIAIHIGLNRVDPNHYKDASGDPWNGQLFGCEADARDMAAIAPVQGFTSTSLLNEPATSNDVLSVLADASTRLASGDIILVTYSGHGSQVPDLHRDEESDKLDETWCLFDRQLVDDELYACWSRFA